MKTPLPGQSVKGSSTGVPIMSLFDLLGRKWNMRILWELSQKTQSFRQLQDSCGGVSPSVMNSRIKQLTEAQLLITTADGYQLTELGVSLVRSLDPLRAWSNEWATQLSE